MVLVFIIFCVVALMFLWIILTRIKIKEIQVKMRGVSTNLCNETVLAAADALNNMNGLICTLMSTGGDKSGVNFDRWRNIFNNKVIPAKNISKKAKKELRKGLVRIGTYNLREVYDRKPYGFY